MKRRFIALTLAVLAATLSSSAQNNYYPAKVGLKWTYSNGETQSYSREDTVFNTRVLVLTHSLKDKVVSEDYVQSSSDGVVLIGTKQNNQVYRYQPVVTVYPKAPLKVGTTWTNTLGSGTNKITLNYTVTATAGVKVKAGRFNAFVVNNQVVNPDGSSSSSDLYFVPSIGTVKYVYQDGTVVELQSR